MTLPLQWDPYVMYRNEAVKTLWSDHLMSGERSLLYVLGRGFDPRMCRGLETLADTGKLTACDCQLIEFDEGPDSPSLLLGNRIGANEERLKRLIDGRGSIRRVLLPMWSGGGRNRHRISSRNAAGVFVASRDLHSYTDVVVDISAMPRSVYFSLIAKLLYLLTNDAADPCRLPNLHVIVAESPALDQAIQEVGPDETASYVHSLGGDLDLEGDAGRPRVWFPIIGERQHSQLERIHNLIEPVEICPVLPSPARNPRRGDGLLLEYREVLFDQWRIEACNIVYASEHNPFEAYRQIAGAAHRYAAALEPLGGCQTVISALSSKSLSMAALLATYDLRSLGMSAGLALVECQGYSMPLADEGEVGSGDAEISSLWLTGECYA